MFRNFVSTWGWKIGLVFIAVLLLGGAAVFKNKSQVQKVVTDPNTPALSFSVEPQINSREQDFDLIIYANPGGQEFHAFELYFTFDPAQAEFQDEENAAANIISSYALVKSDYDTSTRKVTLIGTRLGSSFSGNENVEIARIRMNSIKNSLGSSAFVWDEQSKIGNNLSRNLLNY